MDGTSRAALIDTLRNFLGDYVDPATDSVGHAFPMGGDHETAVIFERDELYTVPQVSSVERLADSLTRGAAVAGIESIAELLASWANEAPMSYRTCVVLPITMARAVSPIAGVDIVPLPLSTAELPAGLPARYGKSRSDYLGQVLASIDAETTPALFRPETRRPEERAVRAALKPPVTLETIREALSLESGALVDGGLAWDDYGEFYALANQGGGVRGTLGRLNGRRTISWETGVSTLELPEEDIRDLSEENIRWFLQKLHDADDRTRRAVSRWKMAINEIRGLPDRFIDLRIALESLFLSQQPNQELKFRLAVTGAWLVGENADDRRQVYDTLVRAYDLSSTAVHGSDVNKKKDGAPVLAKALAVCRRGIRHVLCDGPIKDEKWLDLILDRR